MQLFFLCAIAVMQLEAGVEITANKGTTTPNVKTYFNASNTVSITITLSGSGYEYEDADNPGISNLYPSVYEGSSNNPVFTSITTDMPRIIGALSGYSTIGVSNSKTYEITKAQLNTADNGLTEGRYFDFKIGFTTYVGDPQTTPDGFGIYYPVDFADDVSDNLIYDVTAPTVSCLLYTSDAADE